MTSRVMVALRVPVDPQSAFDAFTGEIGQWWRASPMFQFTPRSPGVLSFEPGPEGRLVETLPGGKVFEVGKVLAWDPPSRLVFGWRQASFTPDQQTRVEITFEAVGVETRVTVQHFGWDTVPQDHVARHHFPDAIFLRRHGEWWQALLASYKLVLGRDRDV